MIILNVDKLSKNFGYGVLFENLSFSLNEGESISIVGPNGFEQQLYVGMYGPNANIKFPLISLVLI